MFAVNQFLGVPFPPFTPRHSSSSSNLPVTSERSTTTPLQPVFENCQNKLQRLVTLVESVDETSFASNSSAHLSSACNLLDATYTVLYSQLRSTRARHDRQPRY
ncbi:hypothetical protein DM01DRAFT_1381249 [Hesseltinella vesiculosa]|uniref:Uncharacterized protein n=1 Tax=Hesseltinella vesiculosa TaxID=101127 RepID=A0A1X2GRP1_9FUNG|nr:hypothetical protein DM01DRAFT_1381249 [Hesseltinella vesiculosa]